MCAFFASYTQHVNCLQTECSYAFEHEVACMYVESHQCQASIQVVKYICIHQIQSMRTFVFSPPVLSYVHRTQDLQTQNLQLMPQSCMQSTYIE